MLAQTPPEKRGQFIWMPKKHRDRYVRAVRARIQNGYYAREQVIAAICEKLAPVFDEQSERSAS